MPDSPSGWLRSLAAEATPGGWEWKKRMWPRDNLVCLRSRTARYDEYPGVPRSVLDRLGHISEADARLIALAPDLAVLCADAIDALEAIQLRRCNACDKPAKAWGTICPGVVTGDMTHYHSADWWAQRALARFAALQPDNTEEGKT